MIGVARAVGKYQRRVERSWGLYSFAREQGRAANLIRDTISATLKPTLTIEEKNWVDRIEHLRGEVNASATRVTRMDYGAGSAQSKRKRTQLEMSAGVETSDGLGRFSQSVSKPPFWCLFLFELIRTVRPKSCIEMGAAVGISAAYQAAALQLNGHGSLATLEGAPSLAAIATANLQRLELDTVEVVVGQFQDTLRSVLVSRRPVDYVFVDGHHDEQATVAYFELILPFLAPTAFLVFDDIVWSAGMKKAWTTIANDERISISISLGPVGLCVVDSVAAGRKNYRIPLR